MKSMLSKTSSIAGAHGEEEQDLDSSSPTEEDPHAGCHMAADDHQLDWDTLRLMVPTSD